MVMTYIPVKKKMRQSMDNRKAQWHDKKKLDVVLSYLETGNLSMASKEAGVPYNTASKWKMTSWWKDIVKSVEEGNAQSTSTKYQKLVKKALTLVEDRMDNGDFILDSKSGEVIRVPIKARDASKIASDAIQTKERLDRIINKENIQEESINMRLMNLAEQFAKFALGKKNGEETARIIEGEVIEAFQSDSEDVREITGEV